jgi:hypothetical protein
MLETDQICKDDLGINVALLYAPIEPDEFQANVLSTTESESF